MKIYQGKSLSKGIVTGKIAEWTPRLGSVEKRKVEDTESEIGRFTAAKEKALEELNRRYRDAGTEVGAPDAAIFEAQKMILRDTQFNERIRNTIMTESVNAEYAVEEAGKYFADSFENMEEEQFRSRADDIRDVTDCIGMFLANRGSGENVPEDGSVIILGELLPGAVLQLRNLANVAIVSLTGSENSHAAILCRAMNIPLIRGTGIQNVAVGTPAIADGNRGKLILEPDRDTLIRYGEEEKTEQKKKKNREYLIGEKNESGSGRKLELYANISDETDLRNAVLNDAAGIGLFRSEFLFLNRNTWPTEEEQFRIYKNTVRTVGDKPVTVRTADLGADKKEAYMDFPEEENPALGLRGIRFGLKHPDILKTQIRALLRAAVYGNLSVLYPMIASVGEMKKIREIEEEAKAELRGKEVPFGNLTRGIMIETPAAALMSDRLATEADFFSIGTNDLLQYTMAADRQNPEAEDPADGEYEALFRLIETVVENGHRQGIPVGICGELGARPEFTKRFMDMGLDLLSVNPVMILPLREKIREMK